MHVQAGGAGCAAWAKQLRRMWCTLRSKQQNRSNEDGSGEDGEGEQGRGGGSRAVVVEEVHAVVRTIRLAKHRKYE